MTSGDNVYMTEGPLAGLRAKLLSLSSGRATLSVVLGIRELQVEIDDEWVAAIGAAGKSAKTFASISQTQVTPDDSPSVSV